MLNLSKLIQPLNAKLHGADIEIKGVSIDTRTLQPGDLFVAITGEKFNGHEFLEEAKNKGAAAIMVSRPVTTSLPRLEVSDTRIALGQFAAFWRQQWQIPMVALTGSCGKTTVKEMLRAILATKGTVLANKGTLNNDFGVPLTLLQLNKQHQFAVIEMGANHPGEIAYLTNITKPSVAFINNIAPAHLEGFGSIEGVARAKSEIFQGLDKNGVALINADDHYADWITDRIKERSPRYFGVKSEKSFLKAHHIQSDSKGRFSFNLHSPENKINIQLPVLGEHNILNALAAATAAFSVGATLEQIKSGLENMEPVAGRLVVKKGAAGSSIFDDTYNANPSSMRAALLVLAKYPGKRVFVMGDMGELGPTTEELHSQIGALAKELKIDCLLACGKLSIAAVKAFGNGAQHFASQAELTTAVRPMLDHDVTVLVKGSRSAKMENVVAGLVDVAEA